jgi:adhesin HecA-like repeat protein
VIEGRLRVDTLTLRGTGSLTLDRGVISSGQTVVATVPG